MSETVCCPYCNHHYSVAGRVQYRQYVFQINNHYGDHIAFGILTFVCANPKCLKPEIHVVIGTSVATPNVNFYDQMRETVFESLLDVPKRKIILPLTSLLPARGGKVFNDVPPAIWQDYDEACKISELSPKASATIARRCLQNMIRDFWGISSKRSLKDEINEISSKPEVTASVRDVLHDMRELGNIGAHPEKDINTIVDIEPGEVELIIRVLEMLFVAWYGKRAEEQKLLAGVKQLNTAKQQARNP